MERIKIGFIGAGNMARALGRCLADKADLMLFDINKETAEGAARSVGGGEVREKADIARECSYIFLAVKPNALCPALDGIRDILKERNDCTLVSMLAGISIENIEVALGFSMPIIRIMPNTPVAVGRGVILWCPSGVDDVGEAKFVEIMQSAGLVRKMDEGMIDAGTAISGCSPAFTYMFEKALANAGVAVGLDKETAEELAKATVEGSSMLSILDSRSLEELTRAVCSPGGSTIEGVKVLTDTLDELVGKAVRASYERTRELGERK